MTNHDQPYADRMTARIVGVLFIIATVLYLIGGSIYGPSTGPSEYLENAYPDRTTVILGVLVEFFCVLAIPLIAMFLFPLLRRWHEPLALAYVGFRTLEVVFLIGIEAKVLSLIDISEDHLAATGTDAAPFQAVGDGVLAEIDRLFVLYVLVFAVGALILYGLLYQSQVVARWLSGWGFVAAAWMLVGTIFIVLTDSSGALVEALVVTPLALNEMVLAVVLIARGFSTTVAPADDADADADAALIETN
jgi:hypothetical protein